MALTAQRGHDPWPEEREGYHQPPPVAYVPVPLDPCTSKESPVIRRAEQIGSLVAGGGIIWTAYAVVHHSAEITRFVIFPPGPLEVLGVGVLMWLIAKWCRACRCADQSPPQLFSNIARSKPSRRSMPVSPLFLQSVDGLESICHRE